MVHCCRPIFLEASGTKWHTNVLQKPMVRSHMPKAWSLVLQDVNSRGGLRSAAAHLQGLVYFFRFSV